MLGRPRLVAAAFAILAFAAATFPARADALTIHRVVILSGSRTNGVVRLAVLAKRRDFDECLRSSLATVSLTVRIDTSGAVVDAEAHAEGVNHAVLECIAGVARTLTLGPSDDETRARIHLSLTGLGGPPVHPTPGHVVEARVPPTSSN